MTREEIKLRILDYYDVLNEIENITENGTFKKQQSVTTIHDKIEIPYYTLGKGNNHIVVVGGTHGSEIISTDFVLRLMKAISTKQGIYSNIDLETENGFTFHFIPMHNPEGYIISTSAIRQLIPKDASEEEIETISKKYFLNYRQDDINVKNNPNDKSHKLHQIMFQNASYKNIPEEFKELRNSVKNIYSNELIPKGSIVVHRGNGLGEETNRSILAKKLSSFQENKFYNNRYNNIDRTVPGPLGTMPQKKLIENVFLDNLISQLYKEHKYVGTLLYHGTGGMIYSKISYDEEELFDNLPDSYKKDKYSFSVINRILTRQYHQDTKYITMDGSEKTGYRMVTNPNLSDYDEWIRLIYPATLLIELSYMGGNPIGPLGDKFNNYIPTIEHNLVAAHNYFRMCQKLKSAMYGKTIIVDNEISEEFIKRM